MTVYSTTVLSRILEPDPVGPLRQYPRITTAGTEDAGTNEEGLLKWTLESERIRMRKLAFLLAYGISCAAQTNSAPHPSGRVPSFEVASIKPAPPPDQAHPSRIGGEYRPGQFTWTGATLWGLILMAYDVPGYQLKEIAGLPPVRDHFEVVAKVPDGTDRARFCAMLQNMLAERFGVVTRFVSREVSSYDLVVANGGVKLKNAERPPSDAPQQAFPWPADGWPMLPPGVPSIGYYGRRGVTLSHLAARMSGIPDLVRQLELVSERPVIDKTGLTGVYDFTMDFITPGTPPRSPDSADLSEAGEPGPDLFAALERQLGLKLVSSRTVDKVLVVDKFNLTPTEN